jgi:hypothetical protein
MRLAKSTFTDVLTVHAGDVHRQIQPNEIVDLHERIGAERLEAALGAHAEKFEDVKKSKSDNTRAATVPAKQ